MEPGKYEDVPSISEDSNYETMSLNAPHSMVSAAIEQHPLARRGEEWPEGKTKGLNSEA